MEKESIRRHTEMMMSLEEICHQLTQLTVEMKTFNLNFKLRFMNEKEDK